MRLGLTPHAPMTSVAAPFFSPHVWGCVLPSNISCVLDVDVPILACFLEAPAGGVTQEESTQDDIFLVFLHVLPGGDCF